MLFYKKGRNILTQENLKALDKAEKDFMENKKFATEFCLLQPDGQCAKPMSLIRFFDGTFRMLSGVFHDPDFENIEGVLHEAVKWVEYSI